MWMLTEIDPAEPVRLVHAGPAPHWLWWREAQIADRRLGEGDASEDHDLRASLAGSLDDTTRCGDAVLGEGTLAGCGLHGGLDSVLPVASEVTFTVPLR